MRPRKPLDCRNDYEPESGGTTAIISASRLPVIHSPMRAAPLWHARIGRWVTGAVCGSSSESTDRPSAGYVDGVNTPSFMPQGISRAVPGVSLRFFRPSHAPRFAIRASRLGARCGSPFDRVDGWPSASCSRMSRCPPALSCVADKRARSTHLQIMLCAASKRRSRALRESFEIRNWRFEFRNAYATL